MSATAGAALATCDPAIPDNTPASRYELNGATAYDKQTDLTWQRCSVGLHWNEGAGCAGQVRQMTWDEAMKQGGDGWRVPSVTELQSLISSSCRFPAINEQVFPGVGLGNYWFWSSTSGALVIAWGVGFGQGDPDSSWRTNVVSVRLVKSGR
ncbi:MAG TPA: DUF1566 domain-containing protein [Caulobacteraceae bacterium]|nr:DUF1566 domain-containing protein [Caulobacteraceae bacterium]